MVAKSSGIKNKQRLMKYLYKNPNKLAMKLMQFLKDENGEALPLVTLKGKGQGYYYSMNDKKLVRVVRNGEFYLLPWEHHTDISKCYVYTHFNWLIGCIIVVNKDEIQHVGYN